MKIPINEMIAYNPVTGEKGACVAVGRGAVAIRLALEKIGRPGSEVLVPANICYAAVLPVLYAGYRPCFCDVDPDSGNVTPAAVRAAYHEGIAAAILPHMYGNPIPELPAIAAELRAAGTVLIEDCASLMTREEAGFVPETAGDPADRSFSGAAAGKDSPAPAVRSGAGFIPGTVGDFTVYSTGYSKTVDIGFGGMLFSKNFPLADLEEREQRFPAWKEAYEREWKTFSAVYRALRNNGQSTGLARAVYRNLPEALEESFSFSVSAEQKQRIFRCVEDLDRTVRERKRQYALYRSLLEDVIPETYPFEQGAVPWRYNLLVRSRDAFVRECLGAGLPVSDWYPRVTPVFGGEGDFPGAARHEARIVNFPLMIADEEIRRICRVIRGLGESVIGE